MEQRVTAAKLLQGHIADLLPGVLEDIEPLRDVADRQQLEEQLRPWLAQEVAEEIGQMIDSRDLLEGEFTIIHPLKSMKLHFCSFFNQEIVKQVLKHRAELYTNLHRAQQDKDETESKAGEDEVSEIKDAD